MQSSDRNGTTMTEHHDAELNRYWNALVRGDRADPFALDANDMETVRRLHLGAVTMPAGRRADEAWPGVLARMLEHQGAPVQRAEWRPLPLAPPAAPNGYAPDVAPPASRSHPNRWRGAWRVRPGMVATAALLLLTLVAGFVAVAPPRAPDAVPLPAVENAGIAVGQFESLWQAFGGPERLDNPSGLAVDDDGNIWVVDANRGMLDIFAPDGTYLESWGGPGDGDGQFAFFAGMHQFGNGDVAFGPDGSIYVLESGNFRVQRFGSDRGFVLSWGEEGEGDGQFLRPVSIAVDPSGNVFVSDAQRADVQVFDAEGRFLTAFGGLGVEEGQLILPQGLAVDARGMLWVVDRGNSRLQQFDAEGTVHAVVGKVGSDAGEFSQPYDVAVDPMGRLYVADEAASRVQVLGQDGRPLASVSGYADNSLFSPIGVAVGADGAVYVSDKVGLKAFKVAIPAGAVVAP